jgi:hypothetical protein
MCIYIQSGCSLGGCCIPPLSPCYSCDDAAGGGPPGAAGGAVYIHTYIRADIHGHMHTYMHTYKHTSTYICVICIHRPHKVCQLRCRQSRASPAVSTGQLRSRCRRPARCSAATRKSGPSAWSQILKSTLYIDFYIYSTDF